MLHNMLRAAAGRDRVPMDGLVVYYKMDNVIGATLVDETSNGNDASLKGDPQQTTGPNGDPSVLFDGSGDYGIIDAPSGFSVSEYTIISRVNISSLSAVRPIFNRDSGANDGHRQWQFRVDTSGRIRVIVFDSADTNQQVVSNTALSTDTDYDVAMVVSSTDIKIYINKSLDTTESLTLTPNTGSTWTPFLAAQVFGDGTSSTGAVFHGYQYRALFYDHAKTDAEIAAI